MNIGDELKAGEAAIAKAGWKRIAAYLIGAAGLLLLGYAWGRFAAPSKVVVTEKLITVEKQVVVTQVKTEVQKVYVSDARKHVHTEELEVKHPDGTDEKKTTTDENVDTVVHEQEIKYVDRVTERVVEKEVYREREKSVYRDRASWSLAILAGAYLPDPLSGPPSSLLPARQLVLGAEVGRRILGPLSVGAWGLTSGEAGVKLGIEF